MIKKGWETYAQTKKWKMPGGKPRTALCPNFRGFGRLISENAWTEDNERMVECERRKFSESSSMLKDNGKTKRNLKYEDFVLATTDDARCIDCCLETVQFELQACAPAPIQHDKSIGSARCRNGSILHLTGRVGNGVYKSLPLQNEFSWFKLISDHANCGRGREAIQIYKEMREKGVTPESYTYVAALKACGSVANLEAGKEIHLHVIESRNQSDIFVANTLVHMYVKCGSMVLARQAFEKMPSRNVVSWNAMIMGYAQDAGEEALQLYARMQDEGFVPNARTFVAVLKACGSLAAQEKGKQVDGELVKIACLEKGRTLHTQAAKSGFEPNIFVASTLVDMYSKCGSMVDACQVFEKTPYHNVVSWTAMIMGFVQMEKGELALKFYSRMQHEGFTPNDRTFVAALKACATLAVQEEGKRVDGELVKIGCLEKGKAIHSQVAKSGFESDIFVANTLIGMYVKCGSMMDARQVFEKMPYHNLVSWNSMIVGYAQMEKGKTALQLYNCLQYEGLSPDAHTFVAALKACSSLAIQEEGKQVGGKVVKTACLEIGRAIHSSVARSGFEADIFIANSLLDMYVKCGSMVDAHRVFERMLTRDIISWTSMIRGYAQRDEGELALQLYSLMRHEGFTPDAYTFVAALMACSNLVSLETGKEIHAEVCRVGLENDAFVMTSLVDMYAKCGSMVDAQLLFDALPVRDVISWSALIAGYSSQGNSSRVFDLFEKMQEEGIQPDGSTFLLVLTVCSRAGLVDKGKKYLQAMCFDCEISPASEHYNCMVDLLGRASQMEEAVAMVKKMPFPPDIVSWKTILGACQKWKNVEVGRYAFECATSLDEQQTAAYVLMTNIYASANMWGESAKLMAMKPKA